MNKPLLQIGHPVRDCSFRPDLRRLFRLRAGRGHSDARMEIEAIAECEY